MAAFLDTIVAIATPPGPGGVGIVRLSGPDAKRIATEIAGSLPPARLMGRRAFRDANGAVDHGLIVCFDAPHSYTGEDIVEFHGHGSPIALDLLTKRALELGARMAGPGEFTERAYLNDRMDLAEAEAVADLIDAGSAAAARAALRSLSGEFSRRVNGIADATQAIRIEVEASIDFVDEDIHLQQELQIHERLHRLRDDLANLLADAGQGRLLTEGCTVVIAGRPNAGKSSLLNTLAGHDAAIVTDVPGTTRDILREQIHLDGLPVTLLDTAGLRETCDIVEIEGIRRAKASLESADHILYLVDATDPEAVCHAEAEIELLRTRDKTTLVYTKCDLTREFTASYPRISVKTGVGITELRQQLLQRLGYGQPHDSTISARRRHLDALQKAAIHLAHAAEFGTRAESDLYAEELRRAHDALGEITGRVTSDDLLGSIFATFCIGK